MGESLDAVDLAMITPLDDEITRTERDLRAKCAGDLLGAADDQFTPGADLAGGTTSSPLGGCRTGRKLRSLEVD